MKYIYILLISLLFVSCNDDFLDTFPKTKINQGTFWNSEADLKTFNNHLYGTFFNGKGFGTGGFTAGLFTSDMLSDNAFVEEPSSTRLGINTSEQPGRSNWDWSLIRDINEMLENAEGMDLQEGLKNRYIAEARLIRALDYYAKVKLYGMLPLVDRVFGEKDEALFAAQVSRDEIVHFIMDDLDYAVQWLPVSGDENRFDKFVGHSYRARIMLHEGTFRKYHGLGGENEFLTKAVTSAMEVINSGRYIIDAAKSYNSLFSNENLKGNKEVVFYKDYGLGFQLYHNVGNLITHSFGATFGGSKSLIQDYLCTDGQTIDTSPLYMGEDNITNEFANRDLRLSNTFAMPNTYFVTDKLYVNSDPIGIVDTATPSGYQVAKFYNAAQDPLAWGRNTLDAPLIRYAEVLLILAEAKAELGTLNQSDIDLSINLLRAKAGVADMALGGNAIEEIRRERRVELAFEGFRFDDLMRTKQGGLLSEPVLGLRFNTDDIHNASAYQEGLDIFLNGNGYILSNNSYLFDENKNYYFPVPLNELSLNPNLNQTSGW